MKKQRHAPRAGKPARHARKPIKRCRYAAFLSAGALCYAVGWRSCPAGWKACPPCPKAFKAVSRGRSGPLPPTTRAGCLSAGALCYARVGKTRTAHPNGHNPHYDRLFVTFRGWRGCGRSTVVLVVLRLPRHPRNVTQSKYLVFIIMSMYYGR